MRRSYERLWSAVAVGIGPAIVGCSSGCTTASMTDSASPGQMDATVSAIDSGGQGTVDGASTSPISDATAPPDAATDFDSGWAQIPPTDAAAPPLNDGSVPLNPDSGVTPPLDGGMPWLAYNYSPAGHMVVPTAVTSRGTVTGAPNGVLAGQPVRVTGKGSALTFDFGREVGGIVTIKFGATSDAAQSVGLAFSESSLYVGTISDQSSGVPDGGDGALVATVTANGTYTMPTSKLRGGFRYLTVFLNSTGWAEIAGISLNFSPAPSSPAPNQYVNYFYSNDSLLNRIWYAGAYTVQLNTIDPKQGRAWPGPIAGWDNGANIGSGASVLVDGAKRDRTVWPGDLGISVPVAYVSTGDMTSTKNSLDTLFAGQDVSTGEFPRSGPPLNAQLGHTSSDTYHLWTLLGAYNYVLYTGDKAWLDSNWSAYKKGLAFETAKILTSGLLNVTLVKDWGRIQNGGANIEANALFYRVLTASAELAAVEGDATTASTATAQAKALKASANSLLWNATAGAFRDDATSSVYPQDGNALAIWFGLVDSDAKAQTIVTTLRKNWNAHGAHTPECDPARATISPFAGSMEVAARFVANDDQGAVDLIRLEWGYMLNASIGTASTFWEGYLDDGSFGYGGSYMSAAHGWSAGPTFAMTQWTLGAALDSASTSTFHVVPHPADLTHVEGSLILVPGKTVRVSYDRPSCGDFTLRVDSSGAVGYTSTIGIPRFGKTRVVQYNKTTVWDGAQFISGAAPTGADQDANYVYIRGVPAGQATFTYSPSACP